jgi:hypothetical protein
VCWRTARFSLPDRLAPLLLRAPEDLPWMFEAQLRHGLRRMLLLTGAVPWRHCDAVAAALVEAARREAGIRQPTGWDAPGDRQARARRCGHCGAPLINPGPKQQYCRNGRGSQNARNARRKALHLDLETRRCVECGTPLAFEASALALYCGDRYKTRAWRRRKGNGGCA